MTTRWLAWGLRVDSTIAIPGAIPAIGIDDPAVPDIVIREGVVPALPAPRIDGPYALKGDTLIFTMPNVARYRCAGGTRITVERSPDADPAAVEGMLIATALPAVLWMRGDVVLHAAALALPGGRALAIAGPSGSGKSAALERLLERGARVVADDTIRVTIDRDTVRVAGLPGCYFRTDGTSPAYRDRIRCAVPPDRRMAYATLGTFVAIHVGGVPGFLPASRMDALQILLHSRHRPRVPRLLRRDATVFPVLARLAEELAVHRWTRPEPSPGITPAELSFLQDRLRG